MTRLGSLRTLVLTVATIGVAGSWTPVCAQDSDDLQRSVARISLMNGDVSVRRGDSGEWVAGVVNAPLLTGDYVGTGLNSRAEVQFDASNVLRLGANGDLRLTQLEYGRTQMELAKGILSYRAQRTTESNVEIDTPSLSVWPSRQGSYRIAVNDSGETEVTARGGDVEVFTPHGSQWVHSGQTLLARGAAADAEFQVVAAGAPDEWDQWCESRDRTITQSASYKYVGPGVYGAEDLDAYGNWNYTPDYGYVWHPVVAPGWSPYHSGRWVWEDWYGWTWVSYDPWGWAPYHYGRWYCDARWGWSWYPGLITARHYWSPALVGFFGFGHGVGVGFGFGNVGWVPLAPFEVFHPWWGRGYYGGAGYVNRSVNITNVNVTSIYRNARFANGVNSVAAADFQAGRFNNVARMNGSQIGTVGSINGRMPFTGSAQNQRFSDRAVGSVPRTNENTRFFTHQTPNPVGRSANGASQSARVSGGAAGAARATTGGETAGWRRFGSPVGQASGQAARNDRPATSSQGGWQRFGSPASGSAGQSSNAPRQSYSPSQSAGRQYGSSGGTVRSAPPSVGGRPSGGPSYSAPRQSAPGSSAPRSTGGGGHPSGGGASHPSGGGGGGSRGGHGR